MLVAQFGYAQKLSFELPTPVKAQMGKQLEVKLNVSGIQKYSIKAEGNPATSTIQKSTFLWTPLANEAKNYLVKFFLLDSLGVRQSEADMALFVEKTVTTPTLVFDRSLPDTIRVVENELFFVSATVKSGSGSDSKAITSYFSFDENADLRSFDSCRVNRMGDQILFGWTPSNREAVKGYAKFRITLVDTDNSILSQVLNFKIKNINGMPKFKNEIPDTVFIPESGDLTLDFSAADPDHDNLKYDYSPKSPLYYLQNNKIIFKLDFSGSDLSKEFPIHLAVTASDGEHNIMRRVCIVRSKLYRQPSIGDFTRSEFNEGDSLVTYLNLSNDSDLKHYDIKLNDLALPPGIAPLANRLILERGPSYVKIHSKGILPYYLVDRDYDYNIAVTLSSKDVKLKPVFKVLEVIVRDRPDPTSLGHQKDSLLLQVNAYLRAENIYKLNLDKLYTSVNRPWWKKVAVITGTLSGVLSIVQSQAPNKDVSVVAAVVSLVSITVTNLPSLKEKTLSALNDKISSSKGRIEQIQEKESDFRGNWSLNIDRSSFDKMKADLLERINKGEAKRGEEVCTLFTDKTLKRKIDKLINAKGAPAELKTIFSCPQRP